MEGGQCLSNTSRECGVQKTGFMPPEKIIRKQKKKEEQEESERFGRHLSLFPSQLLGLVIS